MDRLESFGLLRDIDLEKGRVNSVISTGDIARDGAIIEPSGWDFGNYEVNPVVLWMHNDGAVPFARTIDLKATKTKLTATAQFDLDDPMGVNILRKIEQGYINATSVRWLPKKTEVRKVGKGKEEREILVFLEQELLEWSFVTIPADPKALVVRADGEKIDLRDYLPDEYRRRAVEPEPVKPVVLPCAVVASVLDPFEQLEPRVLDYIARRLERPTADDLIVPTLMKATGKTEERIRQELAEGRYPS